MGMGFSALIIVGLMLLMLFVLRRQETGRRSQFGPAGVSEFRTGLYIDECLDRLDAPTEADEFAYTCTRDRDGSFTLHLTLHNPTQQPVDTLYTLRLDAGRETVISLIFLREAFNNSEPVFPPALLDEFMRKKLDARRTR
ncbi:MAG: hypothetical protein IJ347_04635 [Faecalibacterium sp.]|nr:hypothetical protein [Faecalibacterium sp.]